MTNIQKQSLMVCNIVAAILLFLGISTSQGSDLSTLNWLADPGTRVTGPSGCVLPTFVMQRPDGKYGMYFYDGDGESFGDTGYATSTDGMNWTYVGRILTHGGNGFDNINAVITHIISLPGGRLRAYCSGMRSYWVPVQTSIFYTETDDPCGVSWPNPRYLLFPEEVSIGCPRIYGSAGIGYTIYFYSGNQIIRRTDANGIDDWSERQVVIPDFGDAFYIVNRPQGGFRMFVGSGGNIKSLTSTDDGLTWIWDTGSRLTPDLYGQSSLGCPVLADINGIGKMYIFAYPNRQYIYSATPEPPHVLAPNGGENWIAGTTKAISWETSDTNAIPNVHIEYSTNNGQGWNDVNTVPNTGSYNWLVPQVTSNQCLVRISDAADANIFDVSDNTFTIFVCRLNSKADLNGDCKVDMTDLALFANDWMRNGNPFDPENTEPLPIIWVYINDLGVSGHEGFNGQMSKYETTNAQYCQFLNAALASGDIDITVDGNDVIGASGSNSGADYAGQPYYNLASPGWSGDGATNGGAARINYSGGVFTVDSGFDNHPVTGVSWYGAMAFSDYYGYRLPTEWEWQAVADYDGSYTYGCGTSINNSMANLLNSTHPDGTTIVGDFGTYGYGMCDMDGNVFEWTSSIYSGSSYVLRGGGWRDAPLTVSYRDDRPQDYSDINRGFRVCR